MYRVLVVGAGEYQLSGIKKLKEKGMEVIAVDGNLNAIGKKYADRFFHLDIKESKKIIEILEENSIKIDACMSFATELALRTVAEINEKYSLSGLKKKDIEIATNKDVQRDILKENGLNYPKYMKIKSRENIIDLMEKEEIEFPVIIKPVDSSGSRGVYVCENREKLLENLDRSFSYSSFQGEVIIEEMIEGIEFTAESLVYDKEVYTLAISEKRKPLNNKTVSIELFYNSPFVMSLKEEIEEELNSFVKACDFSNTILHTELIYSYRDHKFYIIETTTRSGGYGVFDKMIPFASQKDIIDDLIEISLDRKIEIGKIETKPAILRFFTSNRGKLNGIIELSDIIENIDNIEYGYFVSVGDEIGDIDSDGSRIGYMISYGDSWEEVFNKANRLEYAVKFEIV